LWNRKSKAPWFVSLRPFKPLVLKCCNVLVPLFASINDSQHNNRHSLYQTAKKVLSHFMQHLWHSNMCTRRIPHSLTVQHKTKKQATSFKLLVHFDAGERPSYPGQLKQIKPGSIILHKRQKGKPWYGTILHLPGRNNSRSLCQQASWSLPSGTAKVIFIDIMPRGEAINSDTYIRTLTKLRRHYKQVWPHTKTTEILFQHDNAWSHTRLKTQGAITKLLIKITKLAWTVLPHLSYSPALAPTDSHKFEALKDITHGMKFATSWLYEQDKAWYR
jgi:hypothetical protein